MSQSADLYLKPTGLLTAAAFACAQGAAAPLAGGPVAFTAKRN